jgi:MFS family permease
MGYALMSLSALPAFAVGAVLAFGCGWGWNGLYNVAVSRLYPDAISSATGISQSGIYLGGVLGPMVFGVLVQYGSVGAAWGAMSGIAATAGALVLVARGMFVRPGGSPAPAAADASSGPVL